MIAEFDTIPCKRCGSCNTHIQVLIPDAELRRGKEGEYSTEISCRDCGKINRTGIKMKFS